MNVVKNTNHRRSLYFTFVVVIIATVIVIMTIHSTFSYASTKNNLIREIKQDASYTMASLQENVANLITSYAVNEYEKLLAIEMEIRPISAIIVEDYKLGEITEQGTYISGKIRDTEGQIIEYKADNNIHNKQLADCYYSQTGDLESISGEKVGTISICISDHDLELELTRIVTDSILTTLAISLLLIFSLLISIRIFIFKPLSNMISVIDKSDEDGIPAEEIPDHNSIEIHALAHSMNTMISSIKASRMQLDKKNKELKIQDDQLHRSQKMESLGKLTGGIAHDYNNMLGVILGYAELLKSHITDNKLKKYATEIQNAGKRGAKLTRKLLSFSRQQTPENDAVNINNVLKSIHMMLEKTLTVRIKLSMDLDEKLWSVWLDSGSLEDALLNMSINAMHAMPDGGQLTLATTNVLLNGLAGAFEQKLTVSPTLNWS